MTNILHRQEKSTLLISNRLQEFEGNLTGPMAKVEELLQYAISKLPVDASPVNTMQYIQSQLPEDQKRELEGGLSVPQNHTTYKLLNWISIQQLLEGEIHPDYVMRNERGRALICIYGCGELDPPGHLNTHPDVVKRLYRSYMSHIHILHPFMDATELARKVEVFIQQYMPHRKNMVNSNESHGMKQKHSSEHIHIVAPEMSTSPSLSLKKRLSHRIEHSINNAIILMVLALGAICEHKTALPGFAPDPHVRSRAKHDFATSPEGQAVLNEILSPTSGPGSGISTQAIDIPNFQSPDSVREWETPSQRPHSRYGPENSNEASYPKNVDMIPGLAYYTYAAGILGELQGGCELPFVQASILASFYAGQLAHPFQSHSWICQAARVCSFLMQV